MLKKVLYIVLICLFPFAAISQTPVTLHECRKEALTNNTKVRTSLLQVQRAAAAKKEATTAYFPAIDGNANAIFIPDLEELRQFGIDKDNLQLYQAQLSAQQPIYAGGKIRLANQMAGKGVQMAEKASEKQQADIILETDEAYWQLFSMQEQQKVVTRFTEALDSLEEQLRASYDLGIVPKSELLKVTVRKNEAEMTALEVNNAVRLLQMNLAHIIGRPVDEELLVTTNPDANQKNNLLPDASEISGGIISRPEISILENQVQIKNLEKKVTRADYLPQLGAQVSYGYLEAPGIASGSWNLNAVAQLSVPIFHWQEKKHKMQQAEINEQMAILELGNTRELISLEISQSRLKLEEGQKKIQLANKSKEEASETLSEVEISYNAGLNTITDLLNARVAHQRSEASLVKACTDYEVLKTKWLKAIGQLNAGQQIQDDDEKF
ncbi:TolC family protein [Geofilum sp. OHC36d9]|uniref:TolC family protein n=1 Tax=Geofilum sp. OHC36d9 TaxID=3458413 RepID=UPI004033178B